MKIMKKKTLELCSQKDLHQFYRGNSDESERGFHLNFLYTNTPFIEAGTRGVLQKKAVVISFSIFTEKHRFLRAPV